MKKLQEALDKAQHKYHGAIDKAERAIVDKVLFDFTIDWQRSDGWTLVSIDGDVASLDACLYIIETKGQLSFDDFRRICI